MECSNFDFFSNNDNSDKSAMKRIRFLKKGGKLTRAVYAGLIVCFVPSVLCQGWSRSLTFEEIYNDTNYVQLHQTPRPFIPDFGHITSQSIADLDLSHRINLEDYSGNEIEIDYDVTVSSVVKEPLLVGFSHDPFRYSVPEEDYLKGVREKMIAGKFVWKLVRGPPRMRHLNQLKEWNVVSNHAEGHEIRSKYFENMNPKSIMMKGENRGKRGVLHLYNMMYCATGCEPLSYKGYGCYCGFLGSGRPTDGIDRCCKIHDQCYENIYCPFYTVYFQPYYWKCYRGQPLCALENYHTQHQFINGCAARLCECDRKFAMCVKKYPCPRRRALCRSSPIRLLQNLLMFR